jgi:putative MATE family efflux protein
MRKTKNDLINDPIKGLLIKMTLPMIFGMFGMVIFNMVDTYYVSKLGVIPLAAMTLTFPVVLVINSLTQGIGIGAAALISKAVGQKNHHKIVRYTTDGLILGVILVLIVVIVGLFTIKPLFMLLGGDSQTMPYVQDYMQIWYFGVIFVVIPMIGNSDIRALGDTKTPAIIMTVAAGINTILDPIFIFGFGPIAPMGIRGAALATIIARAVTLMVSLYILIYRQRIVSLKNAKIHEILISFKELLYIGVPNALSKMMIPIAIGIITRLIATYGKEAIAGFGIASRLEMFAMLAIGGLAVVLTPLLGQNIGARKDRRVSEIIKDSERFSLAYGFVMAVVLFFAGEYLAKIFTDNKEVIKIITLYLKVVPISYGIQGLFLIYTGALNVLKKPIVSSIISLLRVFAIYVPLAIFGSNRLGLLGIWIAMVISFVLTIFIAKRSLNKALLINQSPIDR